MKYLLLLICVSCTGSQVMHEAGLEACMTQADLRMLATVKRECTDKHIRWKDCDKADAIRLQHRKELESCQ